MSRRRVHVARAELVLARPAAEPLRTLPLSPDPLAGFAGVFADVWDDERLEVDVDLMPVTSWQARGVRRRLLKQADDGGLADVRGKGGGAAGAAAGGFFGQMSAELGGKPQPRSSTASRPQRPPRLSPAEQVGQRHELRELASKLSGHSPMFALQVLIRAESPVRERARAHVRGITSAWDAWAGENYLRSSGRYVFGMNVGSASAPWRRGWFDRRARTGHFAPPGRDQIVTAREIGALLRPPTETNRASNVIRQAASLPLAPLEIPTWTPERRDLLPLGKVRDRNGERFAGVPLDDTIFAYLPGRSRWGKTELALVQFVSLAASGEGGLFLDPHHDALERVRPYLAARPDVAERVIEMDLTRRDRQPGWNPLSMHGLTIDDLDERVQAVVDAIASTQGWGARNARALNLVTKGAEALCELALRVPPNAAPTIFELTTLLSREDWREAVMPYLRPSTREFWAERFPRLPAEAITAVTNLLDRLRSTRPLAAMLGQPISTIDLRRAMDEGAVVLACPGAGAGIDQVAANLWFYDAIRAAKSRRNVAPADRRRFWLFLDEAQSYDGAASGNIATVLEQLAKFGPRAIIMNQDPSRLPADTLAALLTNRSHLITTAVEPTSARDLARQWAPHQPKGETIANLPKYHYAAQLTFKGARLAPMGLRGVPLEETGHPSDLAAVDDLDAALDQRLKRRPLREVLDELEGHPERVLAALLASERGRPATIETPAARETPAKPAQNAPEPASGDKAPSPTPTQPEPRPAVQASPGRVRVRPVAPPQRPARETSAQDGDA